MTVASTNMSLLKAQDTDDSEIYLKTNLAAALDIIDAHDHSVNSKGLAVKRLGTGATGLDLTLAGVLAAIATYKTLTSGTTPSQAAAPLVTALGVRTAEARAANKGPQIEFANFASAAYGGQNYGILGAIEAVDSIGSGNLNANMNFYIANPASNTLLKLLTLNAAAFSVSTIAQFYTASGIYLGGAGADPGAGVVQVAGRLKGNAVGASAKTLLNFVPATSPLQVTTLTGTGDVASVNFTVGGLPAGAVAASLLVQWRLSTLNSGFALLRGADQVARVSTTGADFPTAGYVVPVTAGATNQLLHTTFSTSGAAWQALVYLLGWYEPS